RPSRGPRRRTQNTCVGAKLDGGLKHRGLACPRRREGARLGMCGIVGYVGPREALPLLMAGLRRLEYRGYDSAGVAVQENGVLEVLRAEGKLDNLATVVSTHPAHGHTGIGHTRWATHGRPTEVNAHPHVDCGGVTAVIHNGIIENFEALKAPLVASGHRFASETDTEVVVRPLAKELAKGLAR